MFNGKDNPHILFLYTRLADYFFSSINYFLIINKEYCVTIVCQESDSSAPFKFKENERLRILSSTDYLTLASLKELVEENNTIGIYVAGWSNRVYRAIGKSYYYKIPIILGMDNPWKSSLRQHVGVLYFRNFLRSCFTYAWCAGEPQALFARKLGFKSENIIKGLYVANARLYEKEFRSNVKGKRVNYPRKLLFVGRYVDYKRPLMLVKVFYELAQSSRNNGWKLELIGDGPLKSQLKEYQNYFISVRDFVPPSSLAQEFGEAGAFCLPSKNEHWGVVIHEAVSAGLPILASDTVYSCTEFLIENYNGWSFPTDSEDGLRDILLKLFSSTDSELCRMSVRSNSLSHGVTQDSWASSLKAVFQY